MLTFLLDTGKKVQGLVTLILAGIAALGYTIDSKDAKFAKQAIENAKFDSRDSLFLLRIESLEGRVKDVHEGVERLEKVRCIIDSTNTMVQLVLNCNSYRRR